MSYDNPKPEVAEAIRIADKHLAGASIERRKALALDISDAMIRCGGEIARGVLKRTVEKLHAKGGRQ